MKAPRRLKQWAAKNEIALYRIANFIGSILIGLLLSAGFIYQIFADNWR
jgi:hypothetical protein